MKTKNYLAADTSNWPSANCTWTWRECSEFRYMLFALFQSTSNHIDSNHFPLSNSHAMSWSDWLFLLLITEVEPLNTLLPKASCWVQSFDLQDMQKWGMHVSSCCYHFCISWRSRDHVQWDTVSKQKFSCISNQEEEKVPATVDFARHAWIREGSITLLFPRTLRSL